MKTNDSNNRPRVTVAGDHAGRARWPLALGLCAVTAGAFVVRVLNWRHVFTAGGVRFVSPDAMYHMRRVFNAVRGGLAVPDYDAFMNYPVGFHSNLPPLFDQVIAAAALAAGGGSTAPRIVEAVGALVPPVLGAATAAVVFLIARSYVRGGFALASAALFALLPYHIQVSVLGRPDHHVGAVLFSSLLILLAVRLSRATSPGRAAALSVLGGFLLFVNLLTWGGALLFVLVLFSYFIALVRPDDGSRACRPNPATAGCCLFLTAAALLLPCAASPSPAPAAAVTWRNLAGFQALLLVCCASVLLLVKTLADAFGGRGRERMGAARAVPVVVMLCLTAVLAFVAVSGGFADFAGTGLRWMVRTDPLQRYAVEGRRLTWGTAVENFSGLVLLFPVALFLVCRRCRREGMPERGILLCAWTVVIGAAAVLQERFSDLFSVNAAVLIGCLLAAASRALRAPGAPAREGGVSLRLARRRAALGAASLLLVCVAAWPTARWLLFYAKSARAPQAPQAAVYDVCLWLREKTPPSPGYRDASGSPGYGVLAGWDMGHAILYVARRANVANNLIAWKQNREQNLLPYRFFATDDVAEAEEILARCGARYVIVEEMVSSGNFARMIDVLGMKHDDFFSARETEAGREYMPRKRALDSMVMRLYLNDGKGLDNFELAYETEARKRVAGRKMGVYKVFEYAADGERGNDSTPPR